MVMCIAQKSFVCSGSLWFILEPAMKQSGAVSCRLCRHYQVTWDMQKPYGCRAHGFKSKKNPALVVFESSGVECQLFEPRKRPGLEKQQ
jgi:hypothetical protein